MLRDNIKALRESKGLTLEDMAMRLPVTLETLEEWEAGTSRPKGPVMAELAEVLGVSVTELVRMDTPAESESSAEEGEGTGGSEAPSEKKRKIGPIKLIFSVVLLILLIPMMVTMCERLGGEGATGEASWTCHLNGNTYICNIQYNDKYEIVSVWGDVYFSETLDMQHVRNVNKAQKKLYRHFKDRGGTVELTSQEGPPLDPLGE